MPASTRPSTPWARRTCGAPRRRSGATGRSWPMATTPQQPGAGAPSATSWRSTSTWHAGGCLRHGCGRLLRHSPGQGEAPRLVPGRPRRAVRPPRGRKAAPRHRRADPARGRGRGTPADRAGRRIGQARAAVERLTEPGILVTFTTTKLGIGAASFSPGTPGCWLAGLAIGPGAAHRPHRTTCRWAPEPPPPAATQHALQAGLMGRLFLEIQPPRCELTAF